MDPRDIDNVCYYKDKPTEKTRKDERIVSRREMATEKVYVTRIDRTRKEEIQQAKYPKEQDVGRIMIEEIPEEKDTERLDGALKVYQKNSLKLKRNMLKNNSLKK